MFPCEPKINVTEENTASINDSIGIAYQREWFTFLISMQSYGVCK